MEGFRQIIDTHCAEVVGRAPAGLQPVRRPLRIIDPLAARTARAHDAGGWKAVNDRRDTPRWP
jgi:hypothetical protein